jgi:hypothetical protein
MVMDGCLLRDSESDERVRELIAQVGGQDHYEMLKYLPESSHELYLAKI